jgi:hypothetical protein
MGMKMGNLYEAALTVEGYQSSGWADVYKNNIVVGGSISGGSSGGSSSGGSSSGSSNSAAPGTAQGTRVECENMTLSGQYAGKVSSPFNGVALYANNETVSYTQYFEGSTHDFTLTGASNNSKMARVDLIIGGQTKGTFYFGDSNIANYTIPNVSHGTGNQKIELKVTADDGSWDALLDKLTISAAGTAGNANSGSNSGKDDITITTGIISKHMTMVSAEDTKVLLHDAHIQQGNSGGPLITSFGAVVGLNTYGFGQDTSTEYSCAVYIDYAMDAMEDLGLPFTVYSKEPEPTEPEPTEPEPTEPEPTVPEHVHDWKLNKASSGSETTGDVSIDVGEWFNLRILCKGKDCTENAPVTWNTSKEGVVKIEGFKITGVKAGYNTTLSAEWEGETYSCIIRVRKKTSDTPIIALPM